MLLRLFIFSFSNIHIRTFNQKILYRFIQKRGIVDANKMEIGKQTMTTLLIIEDEVRLADVLYDWFSRRNFQVTVCHDGISGYETALKTPYDVMICDVMLSGMDGFSIVEKLRSMKVQTPVIMLTARVELQDKLQGFEAGAEDYLTKPFEIEELDARIKVLLKKKGKAAEITSAENLNGPE